MHTLLKTECDILVAFSGGKDSVAIYLHLLELGVDPARIILHHQEVDGDGQYFFDWPCTTSYCQAFADNFGSKIIFSYRKGGIKREILRDEEGLQDVVYNGKTLASRSGNSTKRMFPALSPNLRYRWCSSTAKIDVMARVINDLYRDPCDLLICTGERREESANRAKYREWEPHRCHTKKRNAQHWRPIINWTETQVWAAMRWHRIQPHPAYMLGWGRCSCMTCIFNSSNAWASVKQIAPERVEAFAQLEKEIDHTLYDKMTILEKVSKGLGFITKDNFERWAGEAMSTFTSPIQVDEWALPAGAFNMVESCGST